MKVRSSLCLSLLSVIVVLLYGAMEVQSCSPHGGAYGKYGDSYKVDYSHLDHLDASKFPTLSSKIRHVIGEHYKSHGHPGVYRGHQELGGYGGHHGYGGGHHRHHAVSHHGGSSHGWQNPGYNFAAHAAPGPEDHPKEEHEPESHGHHGPAEDDRNGFNFPGF